MSLYRTWRPRTFADLVGQDAVVRTLTTALDTGRLAHAYLFSGPRGSGKTSAAKILARCIECSAGPTAAPDNTCENCTAIFAGTALDVLEIDAASNRGIDEIRALRDAVKFAPASMRMKVYIIDEAHMLTKEGANAFLKTLEEPPPYVVFILATTAPEALPPTILSRCQRYAFRRISIGTMIARMRTISRAEGIVIDDGALGAIAYRADGGLRDALTMLEQVAAFANGPVDALTVDAAFGQTGREFARRLLAAGLAADAVGALGSIDDASDAGTDMAGLIRNTIEEFRHLLVARINPELLARDLSSDDAAATLERARATPQSRLIRGLRLLADASSAARGSGNARLELETAILRYILQHEDPSLDALAARVAALEATPDGSSSPSGDSVGRSAASIRPSDSLPRTSAPPVASAAAPPNASAAASPVASAAASPVASAAASPVASAAAPPIVSAAAPPVASAVTPAIAGAATRLTANATTPAALNGRVGPASTERQEPDGLVAAGDVSLQKIRSLWQNVRARAETHKVTLSAALAHTTVAALDGDILTLRVPDPPRAQMLKTNLPALRNAIAGVLGRPLDVRIVVDSSRGSSAVPPPLPLEDPADLMRYAIETLP